MSRDAFGSWLLAAAALAVVSAAALALLASGEIIPSVIRDPAYYFVQPGVTAWWFVLGGPFMSAPSSATGIAFAAVANAALWLLALFVAVVIVRAVRRLFAQSRS